MIGRRLIMDRLRRGLTKPAPDHMKIIGPRSAGKTVVVEALLNELRIAGKPFEGLVRWDLGHSPPTCDADFLVQLRDKVAEALQARQPSWSKSLIDSGDDAHDGLKEVLSLLSEDGIRVLVVLDGLEKTLASGRFTRNLWDNLLALGQLKSLRYMTVSRGKPHELVRDPDSAASDFWGLFDQGQVAVECFDDEDINAAAAKVPGLNLRPGARTELLNWTLGFPPLTLSVLNELAESESTRDVDAPQSSSPLQRLPTIASKKHCLACGGSLPETAKELQRAVVMDGQSLAAGRSARDIDALTERGFAVRAGDRIHKPSRLLCRFLSSIESGDGSLRRLFTSEKDFISNARTVLELRLVQIENLDESLKRSIEKGLTDLPEYPQLPNECPKYCRQGLGVGLGCGDSRSSHSVGVVRHMATQPRVRS